MFENLTDKLQRVFKNLRGQGKLTEEHLDAALGGHSRSAARRRRQRRRGRRVAGAHPREGAGLRSAAATFARPAGGQDRSRRTAAAAGQARQAAVRFAAAVGVDDRRPARLGQNHHHRQAGQMAGARTATGRSWFRPTCTVPRRANNWRRWPRPSACRAGPARAPTSRWRSCAARFARPSFPRPT